MMVGSRCFLSPNVGDCSLETSLHLFCREATVDLGEFARTDLVMDVGG